MPLNEDPGAAVAAAETAEMRELTLLDCSYADEQATRLARRHLRWRAAAAAAGAADSAGAAGLCWRRALVLLLALPLLQLLALPVARAGRGLPLRSGLRRRGRRRCGRWLRSERSRRGRRRRGRRRNGLRGMRGRQRREGSGGGGDSSEGERGGRQNGAAERTTRRAEALGGEGAGAAEYDQPVSFE